MKHLLLTTIAAVVLVGCGKIIEPDTMLYAAGGGNIEAVKQHLDAGADVNAKDDNGATPLNSAVGKAETEIADLLRKHDDKTWKELRAAGK